MIIKVIWRGLLVLMESFFLEILVDKYKEDTRFWGNVKFYLLEIYYVFNL